MSADPGVEPTRFLRRSFVYRTLLERGARFDALHGAAVAMDFGRSAHEESAAVRSLGLADLSPLPRTGLKGAGAVEWLSGQGLRIGADSNRAYRQEGGALAARLAPSEILVLDGLAGTGTLIRRIEQAWQWSPETPRPRIGYPVPRADSHCWLHVSGDKSPAMFAKICGVDLRCHRFADGRIAQTSVARLSAIVIRDDLGDVPAFHLLADSASAVYLWRAVDDAMAEFGGMPVGLAALRAATQG